jgi:SAM-dependent methyltransferase
VGVDPELGLRALLQEQQDYYCRRAPGYDDWWFRTGEYDRGEEINSGFLREVEQLEDWFATLGSFGEVLELACGTGLWTRHLAPKSRSVLAVDGATETIEINLSRVAASNVDYLRDDIFALRFDRQFDTIFFSFWLSHVPNALWNDFWHKLRPWLRDGGRAIFIDTGGTSGSAPYRYSVEDGEPIHNRALGEREFRVVKHVFSPDDLASRIEQAGWDANVARTPIYFVHGTATPARAAIK